MYNLFFNNLGKILMSVILFWTWKRWMCWYKYNLKYSYWNTKRSFEEKVIFVALFRLG